MRKRFTIWALLLRARARAKAARQTNRLACRPRGPRQDASISAASTADLQTAVPTCLFNRAANLKTVYDLGPTSSRPQAGPTRLATARKMRKRFTVWVLRVRGWVLRLRGRAPLSKADRRRKASMSPPREAPRLEDTCGQQCRLASRNARVPFNRAAHATKW